jgi:hypothetical protein
MTHNRFDDLMYCIQWSEQPVVRPPEMSSEKYQWLLSDGFVTRFNRHRAAMFSPSDRICVDESMLKLVKTAQEELRHHLDEENDAGLNHGTVIIKELVAP